MPSNNFSNSIHSFDTGNSHTVHTGNSGRLRAAMSESEKRLNSFKLEKMARCPLPNCGEPCLDVESHIAEKHQSEIVQ